MWDRKLKLISTLPTNWNNEGADPPNELSIENCQYILQALHDKDLEAHMVSASPKGGVLITLVSLDKESSIECLNDGTTLALVGDISIDEEELDSEKSVEDTVYRIKKHLLD